jgi:WXG100 protein secretion system (Wss), protein YukD
MRMVVTVESPHGRTTLAAPNDVPVEQLLPALAEACRCEWEASRWSLRPRGETPLAPERTLEQAGLCQGAVLELRAEQPPSGRAGGPHRASWAEVALYHARRKTAGLPRRWTAGRR